MNHTLHLLFASGKAAGVGVLHDITCDALFAVVLPIVPNTHSKLPMSGTFETSREICNNKYTPMVAQPAYGKMQLT